MLAKIYGSRLLAIAVSSIIVQLIVFKLLYPYASYLFTDSFSYIAAAASNQDAGTWPIGYSKFLRVFNSFLHSDTSLVCFQYLFLQGAGLYFLATIGELFNPGRLSSWVLFVILVFNPLFLFLANMVSSDAIFIGLSLFWLAILLRMIYRPATKLIYLHAILLAVMFTMRYNAIIYPLIAAAAILLSGYTLRRKLFAMLLPLLMIAGFVTWTIRANDELTGAAVFSPFGGWQLANNALYAYSNVPRSSRLPAPPRYASLDSLVRRHLDTMKRTHSLLDYDLPGIYYLWDERGPLVQFAVRRQKTDSLANYFSAWTALGPLYAEYGSWLIRQYPGAYAGSFCWPNTIRYAIPPLEFLERYNSGSDTVAQVAKFWFHYRDNKVSAVSKDLSSLLLAPYQLLHLVVNLFFILMLILYAVTKEVRAANPGFTKFLSLMAVCWLLNLLFAIGTAPVVLRYEVLTMIGCLSSSLLAAEKLMAWQPARRVNIAVDICAFSLVFLFVYAASAKFFRFDLFLYQLEGYPWINRIPTLVGWAVPLTELGIALLLLYRRRRKAGLYASLVLMILFTAYLVAMLHAGGHLPCSCGGVIESLTWRQHVWFNCSFILIAAAGIYFHHHKNQVYET